MRKFLNYPTVDIREPLRNSMTEYADKVALYFLDEAITYRQLDLISNTLAANWQAKGLSGSRVACVLPNGLPMVYCYVAALKAGVVLVPINYRLKAPEISMILQDVQPSQINC